MKSKGIQANGGGIMRRGEAVRISTLEKEVAELRCLVTQARSDQELAAEGGATVEEACAFLGVKKSTVYVLMDEGVLKPFSIRGRRLVSRRAFLA